MVSWDTIHWRELCYFTSPVPAPVAVDRSVRALAYAVLRFAPVEVAMRYFEPSLEWKSPIKVGGVKETIQGYKHLKRWLKPLREQGYEHHFEVSASITPHPVDTFYLGYSNMRVGERWIDSR